MDHSDGRASAADFDADNPSASGGSGDDQEELLPQNHDFKLGEKFESVEDFDKRLREVQDATFCVYYRHHSETIAHCRKKGVKRHINERLKYYMISYCCIHGGKKFKTTATGQRQPATFQQECEAWFQLNVSKDGETLVVSRANFEHNHACRKSLYQHLPQTRRLKPEERKNVADLLSLGANRKKVKERIQSLTHKVVTLKDLSNMATRTGNTNDLAATVKMLENQYAAECHVYHEDNVFKGLFFVTDDMKHAMKAFPEFIGIDATFKLLNIRAPVYLMIAEDSEGCTEIVACCILLTEDKESMTWCLNCFKKAHPSAWHQIKCVMADKDLLERDVIKNNFPNASVLICIFHSLRTFNREITCDKLGITPAQRDSAKEIFEKMVYCKTEVEYMALYDRLGDLPRSIKQYFDDNWHHIRDEWTLTPNYMRHNFLNTTNNRIESLNAKVKSVVKRHSSMEDFVKDFFTLVSCLHSERDHKAAYSFHKTKVVSFATNSPEYYYSRKLTDYSFQFIKGELSSRTRVEIVDGPSAEGIYETRDHGKTFKTSTSTCDCTPCTSMQLPCRHVFALRDKLEMTLADYTICDKHWTRDYYYKHQRVFDSPDSDPDETAPYSVTAASTSKRVLSQHDKYRKAALLVKDLSALASESTGHTFVKRMEVLAQIKKAWQEGCEVYVARSDEDRERLETSEGEDELEFSAPQVRENHPLTVSDLNSATVSRVVSSPETSSPVNPEILFKKTKGLENITMPPTMKQKGRPKGAEKTIIGLPKRAEKQRAPKKLPFCKQRESDKVRIMLRWFVDNEIAEAAVLGKLIGEEEVEARPTHVSYAVLDEDVNVPLMKRFFSTNGWKIVRNVYKVKKQRNQWECGRCLIDLETTVDNNTSLNKSTYDDKVTIRCDYCLAWYHLACVSLKKAPKTKYWMCGDCRD